MNRSGKELECRQHRNDPLLGAGHSGFSARLQRKRQEEAEAAGGTVTVAETLSEILSSIAGTSEVGSGTSTPVPEASGNTGKSATAAARTETRSVASESESDDENASPQTESENNENTSESGEASDQPDASENAQPGGGGSGPESSKPRNQKRKNSYQQTDGVSALSAVPSRKKFRVSARAI